MTFFGKKARAKYSVRKLSRLDLAEDDVLVVHCDQPLSKEFASLLEESLKKIFGYQREVIVFDKGVVMTVIGKQKDADADSIE